MHFLHDFQKETVDIFYVHGTNTKELNMNKLITSLCSTCMMSSRGSSTEITVMCVKMRVICFRKIREKRGFEFQHCLLKQSQEAALYTFLCDFIELFSTLNAQ